VGCAPAAAAQRMEKVSKIESGLKHSIKNKTIAAARLVVVGAALAFVEDKRYPHH
jgi:hypothetical protein